MVFAAEFVILRVQIHPRQGYCAGGDVTLMLRNFCRFHLQYGGLVGSEDVASLNYRYRFENPVLVL